MSQIDDKPGCKKMVFAGIAISVFWIIILIYGLPLFILGYDKNAEYWAHLGDVISGFIGPIIAIVAIRYAYLAYKEQFRANELISRNLKLSENENKIRLLIEEAEAVANMPFRYSHGEHAATMLEYIVSYTDDTCLHPCDNFHDYKNSNSISTFLSVLHRATLLIDEYQEDTGNKSIYTLKLISVFNRVILNATNGREDFFEDVYCEVCGRYKSWHFTETIYSFYLDLISWIRLNMH